MYSIEWLKVQLLIGIGSSLYFIFSISLNPESQSFRKSIARAKKSISILPELDNSIIEKNPFQALVNDK